MVTCRARCETARDDVVEWLVMLCVESVRCPRFRRRREDESVQVNVRRHALRRDEVQTAAAWRPSRIRRHCRYCKWNTTFLLWLESALWPLPSRKTVLSVARSFVRPSRMTHLSLLFENKRLRKVEVWRKDFAWQLSVTCTRSRITRGQSLGKFR